MKQQTRETIIIALAVGLAFVYFGEYGSRQLRAKPACEANGYHEWRVTLGLQIECGAWMDGGSKYFPLEAQRPGEVDG